MKNGSKIFLQMEMMGSINMCMDFPSRWMLATLSEVCDIELGQSPPSDTYNSDGVGLPFYQGKAEFGEIHPTPVKWCSDPKKTANAGDILISVRAPVGPVNICQETSCIGRGLAAIQPKNGMIGKYVYYYLKLIEKEWDSKATGTTFKAITGSVLRKQQIPVAPTEDQEKIVKKIEELFSQLDAATAALKRVQANLKRYKASVLKAACEGRLVPTEAELARREGRSYESGAELLERILKERRRRWEEEQRQKGKDPARMKYPEPAKPDAEGLPELPEGWAWATVEQIAVHRLGKMLDKAKNKGALRPYLRNINVRWFHFDMSDIQQMRVTDEELANITVIPGDLVVCEGGEPGRCAVWEEGREPAVIQKALHRVRPFPGLSPSYLAYCLASAAHSGRLEKYFTGSTIKHFTGQSLRIFPIPLPPTVEQERINNRVDLELSNTNRTEELLRKMYLRSTRLRQAILKSAFSKGYE